MSGLRLFVQRRRKVLTRVAVLAVIGVGALLAVALPRADANDHAPGGDKLGAIRLLLSPAPVSSGRFMASYALAYR
jgi:hypothetical protein